MLTFIKLTNNIIDSHQQNIEIWKDMVKDFIIMNGISMRELARQSGISVSAISLLLIDKREIPKNETMKLITLSIANIQSCLDK